MNGNTSSERHRPRPLTPCRQTRREFLWESAGGFVGTALATLLAEEGFFAAGGRFAVEKHRGRRHGPQETAFPRQGEGVHRALHVRRVSQVDTFDPKTELTSITASRFQSSTATRCSRRATRERCWPRRAVRRYGQAGTAVSDLYPQLAGRSTTSPSSAACIPIASRTARACSR